MKRELFLFGVVALILVAIVVAMVPTILPLRLRSLFGGETVTLPMTPAQVQATEASITTDTTTARALAPVAAAHLDTSNTRATNARVRLERSIRLLHQKSTTHAPTTLTSTSTHADSVQYYQRLFAD